MKRYTSFKDIDRDLKYLKLKSKINMEEMRMGLYAAQEDIKETVSPMNLLSSAFGSLLNTTLIGGILDQLVGVNLFKKGEKKGKKKHRRRWKLF